METYTFGHYDMSETEIRLWEKLQRELWECMYWFFKLISGSQWGGLEKEVKEKKHYAMEQREKVAFAEQCFP